MRVGGVVGWSLGVLVGNNVGGTVGLLVGGSVGGNMRRSHECKQHVWQHCVATRRVIGEHKFGFCCTVKHNAAGSVRSEKSWHAGLS
jgi:uncharacterized protein YcfJ